MTEIVSPTDRGNGLVSRGRGQVVTVRQDPYDLHTTNLLGPIRRGGWIPPFRVEGCIVPGVAEQGECWQTVLRGRKYCKVLCEASKPADENPRSFPTICVVRERKDIRSKHVIPLA